MALYLGGQKVKINLGGVAYRLNYLSSMSVVNRVRLLSLDNHILKDSNGIYLVPKEFSAIPENILLSLDNHILMDLNNVYITVKEI